MEYLKKNFITLLLISVNTIVFLIMVIPGVNVINPGVNDLIRFGANFNALLSSGEYYRLITHQFVHVGIIHLAVNMAALYSLGRFLEKQLGKFRYLSVYLFSGIAGGLLSASWHSFIVSTGASGAIMGLAGAELALIIKHKGITEPRFQLLSKALITVLINLFIGFVISFIDNAAHIGGLLFGFAFTFLLFSITSFENEDRKVKDVLFVLIPVFIFCLCAFNLSRSSYDYYVAFNRFINYDRIASDQSEGKGYMETEKYIEQLKEIKKTWRECRLMLDTLQDLPADLDNDISVMKLYSYYKTKALTQYIKAISEAEYQMLDSMEFTNALLAALPKVRHGIMPEQEKRDPVPEKSNLTDIKIFYDQNWKETDSVAAIYFREAQVDSLKRVNGFVNDYFINGRIQMKGHYLNDLKDGIFRYYNKDGNYESMGKYIFERPSGKWKNFYSNGQIKEVVLYTDEWLLLNNFWDSLGMQHVFNGNGIFMTYNADGSARDSGNYLNGLKNGTWRGNYETGKPYYIENYINGRLARGVSFFNNESFQYTATFVNPQPIGGIKNYREYLEKNLMYPGKALANKMEGVILVDVTVDSTGKKKYIENVNRLGFGCDEEAIRLVKEGPGFSPARLKGQFTEVVTRVEVRFDPATKQ